MAVGETLSSARTMAHKYNCLLIVLASIIFTSWSPISSRAQDIDGAAASLSSSKVSPSSKGGSSTSSKFRENFLAIQKQQQRQRQVVNQHVDEVQQQQVTDQRQTDSSSSWSFESTQQQQQQTADAEPSIYGSVKGTPGVDFPAYKSIPNTKFTCEEAPFDPGMYADETSGCQVYHMCYEGRRESFLCGIGTVFNQAIMNCDFWHSVDCSRSSQYYNLNAQFGKSSSEPGPMSVGLQQRRELVSSNKLLQLARPQTVQQTKSSQVQQQQVVVQLPVEPKPIQKESVKTGWSAASVSPAVAVRPSFESSLQAVSKTAKRRQSAEQLFSSQRTSARSSRDSLLSPSRRLASKGQFASESAPIKTVASESGGVTTNGRRLELATKTNSVESTMGQEYAADQEVWKPYFRNKASSASGKIGKPARSEPLASTSVAAGAAEASTLSKPEVAQPDQEPAFQGLSTASSPAPTRPDEGGEAASVAKGKTMSTAAPSAKETDGRAGVESSGDSTVSLADGASESSSSTPAPETSTSTATTTGSSSSTEPAPTMPTVTTRPPTTTSPTTSSPQTTTAASLSSTTTTTGSPTTSGEPLASPVNEGSDQEESGRKRRRKRKKKRRDEDAGEQEERANASHVEYAN